MGGACSTEEGNEKCIKYSVGKPERKRPLWKTGVNERIIS
jgi:hypothetical protein